MPQNPEETIARAELQARLAVVGAALASANSICRSLAQIGQRHDAGSQTWKAAWPELKKKLNESLALQHEAMHPESYAKPAVKEAKPKLEDAVWALTRAVVEISRDLDEMQATAGVDPEGRIEVSLRRHHRKVGTDECEEARVILKQLGVDTTTKKSK